MGHVSSRASARTGHNAHFDNPQHVRASECWRGIGNSRTKFHGRLDPLSKAAIRLDDPLLELFVGCKGMLPVILPSPDARTEILHVGLVCGGCYYGPELHRVYNNIPSQLLLIRPR